MALKGSGTGIVVLAAGGASRHGLLRIGSRPPLRIYVENAIATTCDPIVVVLGSNDADAVTDLKGLPVWIIDNEQWEEGIGSSVSAGVSALDKTEVDAVLLVNFDQPLVSASDLVRMVAVADANPGSIVATQAEVSGFPALFPREWFSHLVNFRGDQSPRHLIMSNASLVRRVAIEPITSVPSAAAPTAAAEKKDWRR